MEHIRTIDKIKIKLEDIIIRVVRLYNIIFITHNVFIKEKNDIKYTKNTVL